MFGSEFGQLRERDLLAWPQINESQKVLRERLGQPFPCRRALAVAAERYLRLRAVGQEMGVLTGVKRLSGVFDTDADRDGSLVAAVTENGHDPQMGTEPLNVAAQS